VRGHADRLVHHDDVVVAVEDLQPVDRFGLDPDLLRRGRHGHFEPGAADNLLGLGPGAAVDEDVARFDQIGRDRTREAEQPRDSLIQAHPVQAVRHRQRALRSGH
jgi:hypothetical protein